VLDRALPTLIVQRHPFINDPTSTARVNFARLPPPQEYAGMELAYREQHFRDGDLAASAMGPIMLVFIGSLSASAALILIGQFMLLMVAAIAAPPIALIVFLIMVALRKLTWKRAFMAFVAPIALFFVALACSFILLNRLVGSAVIGAASLALIAWLGTRPFEFYLQWLYAHPRLRPHTRHSAPRPPRPDLKLLATIFSIAVVVPLLSSGLAMLAIVVLSARRLRRSGIARECREVARHALTHYLTYGLVSTRAPGTWMAAPSHAKRWWTLAALLAPFYLALTVGLSCFFFDQEMRLFGYFGVPVFSVGNLMRSPVGWIVEMGQAAGRQPYLYLWAFPIAIALGMTVPPLALLAVFRAPLAFVLAERKKTEGSASRDEPRVPALDDDGRVEWQWYVDRIKDSAHQAQDPLGPVIAEADHLFVGIEPHARFPVLLHEPILSEHAYFVGDSGSGKTSLGLMPLLMQLIRGHAGRDGRRTPPAPIVVLDIKGDPALFHTVRAEALARGQEFLFFTPEKGRASHYFNPFESFSTKNRTDPELCGLILNALSLNHGDGYGRSYFSRQSRTLLLDALRHERKPQSFQDLYEVLKELRTTSDDYKDTVELVSTVHALTQYPMLMTRSSPASAAAIHMPTVIERRQVVYFWLPAAVESISTKEIGKLALYCLLSASIDRSRDKPAEDVRQVYIVIDEFQRLAAENFKVILEQARSFGLAAILANQSVADLDTPAFDLRPTVRTNTRMKRYFSVTDPKEIRDLSDGSGQEIMLLKSFGTNSAGNATTNTQQNLKSRLTVNDILAVSDHPLDSILHVSRGSGYTQFAGLPIIVRSTWPISRETYEERKRAPWPQVGEFAPGEVIVSDKSPVDIDRDRDREAAQKAYEMMQSLLAEQA